MDSLPFVCLQRKVSSGKQTQEMIGNIAVLMKGQPAHSLEDKRIPDTIQPERSFELT